MKQGSRGSDEHVCVTEELTPVALKDGIIPWSKADLLDIHDGARTEGGHSQGGITHQSGSEERRKHRGLRGVPRGQRGPVVGCVDSTFERTASFREVTWSGERTCSSFLQELSR